MPRGPSKSRAEAASARLRPHEGGVHAGEGRALAVFAVDEGEAGIRQHGPVEPADDAARAGEKLQHRADRHGDRGRQGRIAI